MARNMFSRNVVTTTVTVLEKGLKIGEVKLYGDVTLKEIDTKVKATFPNKVVTYTLDSNEAIYEQSLETFMTNATLQVKKEKVVK